MSKTTIAIAVVSAGLLSFGGCAAGPEASPSLSPSQRPLILDPGPTTASKTHVVVDAPQLAVHDAGGVDWPDCLAVSGNRVWLPDVSFGSDRAIYTYTDGVQTARTVVARNRATDLLAHDGKLYSIEEGTDQPRYSRVVSYSLDAAGRPTRPHVLKDRFMAGDLLSLRFDGKSLVMYGTDRTATLISGPGPVFTTQENFTGSGVIDVPSDGTSPPMRFAVKGDGRVARLAADDGYAYFLVEDQVELDWDGWVYRIDFDGGPPTVYHLVNPGSAARRWVVIANGSVYQLHGLPKTLQVLRVDPVVG